MSLLGWLDLIMIGTLAAACVLAVLCRPRLPRG